MKYSKTIHPVKTLIFLFLLLTACASKQITPANASEQQERLNIVGLSLLPPSGEGWNYKIIHPGRIEFGKLGSSTHQSLLASAVLHKLPTTESEDDFLAKISKERWGGEDKGQTRFTNLLIEEKITHEKEDICVRYHSKYEDHQSKYLTTNILYYIVEDIGLICRYPGKENIGVSIGISQRAEPDKLLENFESIANEFLSNTRYEPLPEE